MAGTTSMTPHEFCDRWPEFDSDPNVILLDVREPHERAIASIHGTLNIPMAQIPARLSELDRAAAIVVMCHSGVRSLQVAGYLGQNGFADVSNLDGGIDAWSREVDPKVPRY